jgi:hypothetical protein
VHEAEVAAELDGEGVLDRRAQRGARGVTDMSMETEVSE